MTAPKPHPARPGPARPGEELFPIRTVSSLTGVNVITLRAWERRHGLIRPVRTPTGHRRYRRADIDLINRAVILLDKGLAISEVRDSLGRADHAGRTGESTADSPWNEYRARMFAAIGSFDEDGLEEAYSEALGLYPIEQVTRLLVMPLLAELGTRWERGDGSVAEEHFFGVFMRNRLGARFHHRTRAQSGPRLLAACLPGEQHEVGLLLFALTAHDYGLRPVLLGANMPLPELAAPVQRAHCSAVALSGSVAPDPRVLGTDLPRLVAAAGVPVFVGGMVSVRQRDAVVGAGAIPLGNDLAAGAERIRAMLATSPERADRPARPTNRRGRGQS
jgi:MerR family transcriptional regulator, light-induced transcriptional regulator